MTMKSSTTSKMVGTGRLVYPLTMFVAVWQLLLVKRRVLVSCKCRLAYAAQRWSQKDRTVFDNLLYVARRTSGGESRRRDCLSLPFSYVGTNTNTCDLEARIKRASALRDVHTVTMTCDGFFLRYNVAPSRAAASSSFWA
jgi:hypothetical protein